MTSILDFVRENPAFAIYATVVITAGMIGLFFLALAHHFARRHRKQLKQRRFRK